MTDLTPEQADTIRKLAMGELQLTDPGVRETVGDLTADNLVEFAEQERERAEAMASRHQALGQATDELIALKREHRVNTAGELKARGIDNPVEEVALPLIRAHEGGEISDDDFRTLGIGYDESGELVIAVSPIATVKPAGQG
jgi:hypothetical protein